MCVRAHFAVFGIVPRACKEGEIGDTRVFIWLHICHGWLRTALHRQINDCCVASRRVVVGVFLVHGTVFLCPAPHSALHQPRNLAKCSTQTLTRAKSWEEEGRKLNLVYEVFRLCLVSWSYVLWKVWIQHGGRSAPAFQADETVSWAKFPCAKLRRGGWLNPPSLLLLLLLLLLLRRRRRRRRRLLGIIYDQVASSVVTKGDKEISVAAQYKLIEEAFKLGPRGHIFLLPSFLRPSYVTLSFRALPIWFYSNPVSIRGHVKPRRSSSADCWISPPSRWAPETSSRLWASNGKCSFIWLITYHCVTDIS